MSTADGGKLGQLRAHWVAEFWIKAIGELCDARGDLVEVHRLLPPITLYDIHLAVPLRAATDLLAATIYLRLSDALKFIGRRVRGCVGLETDEFMRTHVSYGQPVSNSSSKPWTQL